MDTTASQAVYKFEGFVLDLVRGALLDPKGTEVPLRAKSFELLRLFVTNVGRLLDRETINQAIWSDVVVTDDAITQCVRDIRRALGGDQQRIIKTVPRRGYVFAAQVNTGEKQRLSLPTTEPLPLPDKPSIAVLAFTNMNGDPDQEYFSDGIADDIITELSRIRWLFVIARNSSFTYKGHAVDIKKVARELGVRYVLEGSVRRSGDRVRVTAQLVEAESVSHIWAERYDRDVGEVFVVQDEITNAVATAIEPAVAGAEQRRAARKPMASLGAWEAYQRGMWHFVKANQADNMRAIEFFHRAIAIDATFAAAYSGLALAYSNEGSTYATLPLAEAMTLAEVWAGKAVEIDPDDADAHAVLAFSSGHRDHEEAWERVALSLRGNPNSSKANDIRGVLLLFGGQPAEGRDALRTALRLNPRDPRNARLQHQIAISYYLERDYTNAVAASKHTIAQHPNYPLTYRWLAAALGQLNRADEARDVLRMAISVSPKSFELYTRTRPPWLRPQDHQHMLEGLRKAGWQV